MCLIDHGPDRFCLWSATKPAHLRTRRSRAATCCRRPLAVRIVRAWPRMIGRCKWRIVRTNTDWAGRRQYRGGAHSTKYLVCLGLIVINSFTVAPAMRGKIERHGKVFFPIRRCASRAGCSVRAHRPCKVTYRRVLRIGNQHVGVGPVPKSVKLALLIQFDGYHHAIAHPLGPCVVVSPVGYIGQWSIRISSGLKVQPLLLTVSVKQLLERLVNLCFAFCGRVPLLGKHIAVMMSFVSPMAITWHARNVTQRDILMRRQLWSVSGLYDGSSACGNPRESQTSQRQ